MRHLLPLLLLSAAAAVGAAEREAPRQIWMMDRGLAEQFAGAQQPQSVQDSEILVFDSFTNASAYTTTTASPRTYMGMPVNLDGAAGNDPMITKVVVYLAYTGASQQLYNSLRVQFQVWGSWSNAGSPVFSNAPGGPYQADIAGPVTLNPNTYSPIAVTLAAPIPLSGLTSHGLAVNFQGDTGSGLADSDSLTSLLRYGANPISVGANALAGTYGYRNVSGQTDFNFAPTDARSFGQANEGMVFQLYAAAPALISQSITNFIATPANPNVGDGSFTVSATGGASGNPVTFSIDAGSASVCTAGGTNGETIAILASGTCTVLADQAGNASYSAAPQVSLPVNIGNAAALVQDGGFEAGFVPTYWAQTSTNFGTPICDASCGGVGPRTGNYWAWFGGAGTAAEAASLEQTGVITAGPRTLNFYVWWSSSVGTPPDPAAFFNVKIDGNTIFTLTPATASAYNAGYTLATVDVSAYADDDVHTLRFESNNAAAAGATNIHLDDISIVDDRVFANGFD